MCHDTHSCVCHDSRTHVCAMTCGSYIHTCVVTNLVALCCFFVLFLCAVSLCCFFVLFLCAVSLCCFFVLFLCAVSLCCCTLQHMHHKSTCNPLQHTATHCKIWQHTAAHCNTLKHFSTNIVLFVRVTTLDSLYVMYLCLCARVCVCDRVA